MRRRTVLASLAGIAGLGGCAGTAGPGTGTAPASGTPPGTRTRATAGQSRPAADNLPDFGDDVEAMYPAWQADAETAPLVMTTAVESASLPEARVEVTLENASDRTFATNFHGWKLHRWEASRWWFVRPTVWPEPLMHLEPGDTYTWTLTVDNTTLDRPSVAARAPADHVVRLAGLGGGMYTFGLEGWWQDEDHSRTRVALARLELDGPQLGLPPSRAVETVLRDGATVRITADKGAVGEEARPATFVLDRIAPPETDREPRSRITEQLLAEWPLRDAMAYMRPDVDRVEVRARTGTRPPFGVHADDPPIEYEGALYRMRAVDRETETTTG